MMLQRVMIAIITFQRPDGLAALLQSLGRLRDSPVAFRVVVVDNDPEGSGLRAVDSVAGLDLEYAREPRPGIAAARNACLDRLSDQDEAVVFVDDDEVVPPTWLEDLVLAQARYDVDVVSGPVLTRFPPGTPSWILKGGFVQRDVHPTGSSVGLPATNNTLVLHRTLTEHGSPRFDESFSMTGGSDTKFFHDLVRAGARFVWCEEAFVEEDQPFERLTLRWMWRRAVRNGNVLARVVHADRTVLLVVASALVRMATGSGCMVVNAILHQRLDARAFGSVGRGVGILSAIRHRYVIEYERTATSNASGGGSGGAS